MNSQKKMVYMQKIFNPSQYRSSSSGLMTLNKENFSRVMIESINKAMSSSETPVKEKHVRKLLIGSFQAESGSFFWKNLPVIKLKENQIVCWKFCHVLHKMLRDGHRGVLNSSYERRQILLDCGNMWRHVEDGYGQLIFKYCTLLFNRINFLMRNSRFPNDLKVTDEQLDEIGDHDPSVFFDLSCEIFDSLDDILRLQELILVTLDIKKFSSMTSTGQCYLAPLVVCIQDSSLLYDYSVKILFKLHGSLPSSTLDGHRDRFLIQHKALNNFYTNTSNLQYFKTLIQIPQLTERPPNFLIASDLQQHVTPQVVMIANSERDSPEKSEDQTYSLESNQTQLLVNLSDENFQDELDSNASQIYNYTGTSNGDSIDTMLNPPDESSLKSSEDSLSKINALESKVQELELKLGQERESNKSDRQDMLSKIEKLKEELQAKVATHEQEVKKFKEEIVKLKYQMSSSGGVIEKLREESTRAKHDNEISQEALKKLVRDLSELKIENSRLRDQNPSQLANRINHESADLVGLPNQKVVDLQREVNLLKQQLADRETQFLALAAEQESQKLDKTKLDDLLTAEMNETDRIIREAASRIVELNEKSRKVEKGVKLQVNEKISEVCSDLMVAVRELIVESRSLQREIVEAGGETKVAEFYQRNSSWTEGLISAAKVVAMTAKSLVDAADRIMSAQNATKLAELGVAAHQIAAATARLVVASRVKASKDSEKLKSLGEAAKKVNQCTANVVKTTNVCGDLMEQETYEEDISALTLHQTKTLEMETQVRLLELEDRISKERTKLGILRRQHYEQESNNDQ